MIRVFSELGETTNMMLSRDYKARFKAEYWQTKIRYEKLKDFCNKIEAYEYKEPAKCPKHDCTLDMLLHQQHIMGEYLSILEKRALIEEIDIGCIESNDKETNQEEKCDGYNNGHCYSSGPQVYKVDCNGDKSECDYICQD